MKRLVSMAAATAALCVMACVSLGPTKVPRCSPNAHPVELPARDFVADYAYQLDAPAAVASLRIVAEKTGGRLVLVGFNEFGVKAFSLTQAEGQVEVVRNLGPLLAVDPSNVLEDLGYARFLEGEAPGSSVTVDRRSCGYRVRIESLSGGTARASGSL